VEERAIESALEGNTYFKINGLVASGRR